MDNLNPSDQDRIIVLAKNPTPQNYQKALDIARTYPNTARINTQILNLFAKSMETHG